MTKLVDIDVRETPGCCDRVLVPNVYNKLKVDLIVREGLQNELEVIMCSEALRVLLQQVNEIVSFGPRQK